MKEISLHWTCEEWNWENGCPFCRCLEFVRGPEGGNCINFKCVRCGAKFNDMWRFGIDLIGWPKMTPLQIKDIELRRKEV